MRVENAISIDDLRKAARRRLPRVLYDWMMGGVEDERGLARNEGQFAPYRLLPKYLLDVSAYDPSRTLFGRRYGQPFGIAPTGFVGLLRPDADSFLAKAAARHDIPFILSGAGAASIEQMAGIALGHAWFQLYTAREERISLDMLRRADAARLDAIVVTVDCPSEAKRERDMRNGFGLPLRITPRLLLDGALHLPWAIDYLRSGGTPYFESWRPYVREGAGALEVASVVHSHFFATHTWDDLQRLRQAWPRAFVVKGILHPDDAGKAVALGADGIILSNHGGRQLDTAPAPLEVLPAIRAAVGSDFPVLVDGGFRRGSDIVIALCLGASFVFLGRATLFGAVAAGQAGALRAVEILQDEVRRTMGQIGCNRVDELGPDRLLRLPSP